MPTIIGVVFFCCGVYCFIFKEDILLGLLIVAGIFQAASAINISERGIQPYYVIATFIIARAFLNWLAGAGMKHSVPEGKWLLLFGFIAIASAIVLPRIFDGIPIYDPKVGIDEGFLIRPALHFGLNNIAQAGFLAWHIATLYALGYIRSSSVKAHRGYVVAFYMVVLIVTAQSVCQVTGVRFPNSLILNNPGYSLWNLEGEVAGTRNPGTFSEPSFVGGYLAMCCAGFLAEYLSANRSGRRVVIALVACGLVASGGSLLTLSLVTLVLLIRYFPFRMPWFLNIERAKRLGLVSLILATPAAFALFTSSGYGQALMVNTVSKADSSSFINRTAADLYGLELLVETHGIGVGLGSSRSSSLMTTLLSNVGVIGTLAFGIFVVRLFAKIRGEHAWLKWAAFALLLNMCINIPDVTMPMLWIPILLAVEFSADVRPIRQYVNGSNQRLPGSL